MRLLCDAVAFCYGPATALKQILTAWRPFCSEVTLAATGTTLEYMARTNLVDTVIHVDTEEERELARVDGMWDVFLSVCNPVGFPVLRRRATIAVYWDFLLWMRYTGGAAEFTADYYLAEMFPGTDEALLRWSAEIAHPILAPVVADWVDPPRPFGEDLTVVCLGGQRSRLTQPAVNSNYPFHVVDCIQRAARSTGSPGRYLVATDAATARELATRYPAPRWTFESLPHDVLLERMAGARRVLTHPGLYSPFESIGLGRPTFFLPPSNYTQILQLELFAQRGLAPERVTWNDLIGRTVPADLPESTGVERVLELVASLDDPSVRDHLSAAVTRWLRFGAAALGPTQAGQRLSARPYFSGYREFLRRIGAEINSRVTQTVPSQSMVPK